MFYWCYLCRSSLFRAQFRIAFNQIATLCTVYVMLLYSILCTQFDWQSRDCRLYGSCRQQWQRNAYAHIEFRRMEICCINKAPGLAINLKALFTIYTSCRRAAMIASVCACVCALCMHSETGLAGRPSNAMDSNAASAEAEDAAWCVKQDREKNGNVNTTASGRKRWARSQQVMYTWWEKSRPCAFVACVQIVVCAFCVRLPGDSGNGGTFWPWSCVWYIWNCACVHCTLDKPIARWQQWPPICLLMTCVIWTGINFSSVSCTWTSHIRRSVCAIFELLVSFEAHSYCRRSERCNVRVLYVCMLDFQRLPFFMYII